MANDPKKPEEILSDVVSGSFTSKLCYGDVAVVLAVSRDSCVWSIALLAHGAVKHVWGGALAQMISRCA